MMSCAMCAVTLFAGGIVVTVATQASLTPHPFDYHVTAASHVVASVSPLSGPVTGGTGVTILGSKLSSNATILFVERDGSGSVTGFREECTWRGLPALGSSDGMVRCVLQSLQAILPMPTTTPRGFYRTPSQTPSHPHSQCWRPNCETWCALFSFSALGCCASVCMCL